jgi:hypothetical protein
MSSHEPDRDDRPPSKAQVNPARLGDALGDLPVPEHGPNFWAELDHRLQGEPVQKIESGELHLPPPGNPGPADPNPLPAGTVSLEEERARRATRRGRGLNRHLGAAAAAVALILAVVGGLNVIQDDHGTDIRAADRPTGTTGPGTTGPGTTGPGAPAEFSATYDGIEGFDGPDGCCSQWRLTVARDGSYRWTSTDGGGDIAFDATTARHVYVTSSGDGATRERPNAFVASAVPVDGPFQGVITPDPLGPIADFVAALARANDLRVTTTIVAGRPAWHYDGPIVKDRLGGDGAPNHVVADVDPISGVLVQLTRRIDDLVVNRFTASDVTVSDRIDRSRYQLTPPSGSKTTPVMIRFVPQSLDEAAAGLPYDLLVPTQVPDGFTLDSVNSVAVDREVGAPTGPEGVNAPSKPVVNMTWRRGAFTFTVTLRPSEGHPDWNDPLGAEGLVLDAQPVRLPLDGRPPLEGEVAVDAPIEPHLWGVTGDVVVTVSGDLPKAELERVAGSLQPHRS